MVRYEYMVLYDCSEPDLNSLGNIGWELIAVTSAPNIESAVDTYYFKRPIICKKKKR